MTPAFWLTVQIGKRRIPIPLVLLFPFSLALDTLALVALSVYGALKKQALFLRIGSGFYLSRLTVALILYGGRFKIGIHDKKDVVRIFGGLNY